MGTAAKPLLVTKSTLNFSCIPRIAPPPLGSEIFGILESCGAVLSKPSWLFVDPDNPASSWELKDVAGALIDSVRAMVKA